MGWGTDESRWSQQAICNQCPSVFRKASASRCTVGLRYVLRSSHVSCHLTMTWSWGCKSVCRVLAYYAQGSVSHSQHLNMKLDVMVHACNTSTGKVEAAGSEIQGHPLLHELGGQPGLPEISPQNRTPNIALFPSFQLGCLKQEALDVST